MTALQPSRGRRTSGRSSRPPPSRARNSRKPAQAEARASKQDCLAIVKDCSSRWPPTFTDATRRLSLSFRDSDRGHSRTLAQTSRGGTRGTPKYWGHIGATRATETERDGGFAAAADSSQPRRCVSSRLGMSTRSGRLKIGWPSGRAGSSPAPGIAQRSRRRAKFAVFGAIARSSGATSGAAGCSRGRSPARRRRA